MSVFKVGRGDFFGTIIPGAFLLINVVSFYKGALAAVLPSLPEKDYAILLPLSSIVSYVLGFFLRVIQPSFAERIAIAFSNAFRRSSKDPKSKPEKFPYINWFYERNRKGTPRRYREFYENILVRDFDNDKSRMEGHTFINQIKIFVYSRSESLRDEIVFCEGIVRFVSGMILALMISIPAFFVQFCIAFWNGASALGLLLLTLCYSVILFFFLWKLKFMRRKEVATIFDALAFLELDGMCGASPDHSIVDLASADHHYNQALIDQFSVERNAEGGLELSVNVDSSTPVLRRAEGAVRLKKSIPVAVKKDLDSLTRGLLTRVDLEGDVLEGARFRYASGGALPIVRLGGKEHACLFYRDRSPIGWNLANGGCDSVAELRRPSLAAIRELQEELLVFDPVAATVCAFHDPNRDFGPPPGGRDSALRLWQAELPSLGLDPARLERFGVRCRTGPDVVLATVGAHDLERTEGVYVSVVPEDLGIEVDLIVELVEFEVEQMLLLDGEIYTQSLGAPQLIGRPIGLFELSKLLEMRSSDTLTPDLYFYRGEKRSGERRFNRDLKEHVEDLAKRGIRSPKLAGEWQACDHPTSLCPVARSFLKRLNKQYKTSANSSGSGNRSELT